MEFGGYKAIVWVSGKSGCRGFRFWCHLGFGDMTMVMCWKLVEVVSRLQCMACCNCSCIVGCASPLTHHCMEKAGPNESKFYLL